MSTLLGTFSPKPAGKFGPVGKTSNNPESEALRQKIIKLMTDASHNSERSLQKAIGPSEYGHPCARQVAYKVAGVQEQPDYQDPMPSIIGVACHAWMEENLPRDEWIPEHKVNVSDTLAGHSDAYHIPTRTVVDWKFLGATQHQAWTKDYVSEQYRIQAHSYGQGFTNAGYPVDRVADAIFCRSKSLQHLFVWSEAWDPAIAQTALNRLGKIRMYVASSGAGDTNRGPILDINPTAGDTCFFCRYKGTSAQGYCDRAK